MEQYLVLDTLSTFSSFNNLFSSPNVISKTPKFVILIQILEKIVGNSLEPSFTPEPILLVGLSSVFSFSWFRSFSKEGKIFVKEVKDETKEEWDFYSEEWISCF